MDVIPLGRLQFRGTEGVLGSSYSNVGGLYSFSTQITDPRIHTDSLHRCLPNRIGCLPRRENSVRGVGRLSFRRTHTSSGNEGSSTVIEELPVVAYLQNQGGTHSFSLQLLCREIILLCDSLQTVLTVRHVQGNLNLIAVALSRFRVPVNAKWELHPVIIQAITLIWDRPLIVLFATRLNYKLETYVSPIPDQKAWAVDAMTMTINYVI
jgi:hypothetical protein